MSDLIRKASIEETVAHRDRALEAFRAYFDALEAAQSHLQEARAAVGRAVDGEWGHVDGASPSQHREIEAFNRVTEKLPSVELLNSTALRLVDSQVWAAIIRNTKLDVLMDKRAKDELRKQMAYVSPNRKHGLTKDGADPNALAPVTVDNVLSTLETFQEGAGHIWIRGIAEAFAGLDSRFKTHDGFKVKDRVIITRAFDDWGHWNHHWNHRDTLLDIERVFLVLEGRAPGAAYAGIVGAIEEERRKGSGARQSMVEGEFFRVRIFQNGNAHLWFTRKDLVKKVNQRIAEFYGERIGWGRRKGGEKTVDDYCSNAVARPMPKDLAFFPTPKAVAERVMDNAKLWHWHVKEPLRVLEPSAGVGNLSRPAATREHELVHSVDTIEIDAERAQALREHGCYDRVLHRDFLAVDPEQVYDRVLMNPPFDQGRDIDHIVHALKFLRAGGRLVSVTSAAARYSSSPKAKAFHKHLEALGKVTWFDLPANSFAPATNVHTCILVLELPEAARRAA